MVRSRSERAGVIAGVIGGWVFLAIAATIYWRVARGGESSPEAVAVKTAPAEPVTLDSSLKSLAGIDAKMHSVGKVLYISTCNGVWMIEGLTARRVHEATTQPTGPSAP